MDRRARRAVVERLLADPPRVHEELHAPPETGVWLTERACYEFVADRVAPRARTLETGLGLSTALFLALGAEHTCVVPSQAQVDALRRYCDEHAISTDRLRVELGRSEDVLPGLHLHKLDVLFVDGSHGFPAPMIDWFYGGRHVRAGGTVVLDDRNLPAVAIVVDFLDADPRWRPIERTPKWAAYQRTGDGPLGEDWYDQPFFGPPTPAPAPRWKRVLRRATSVNRRTR
ncbi:MAG: class I SAM-dependent methyltransferase [Acidimicrobiia bacterium]|nr:class I SAM-dependent methyltransferase [Acidimicrobiia bacterium]